jgi:hypothetical protein
MAGSLTISTLKDSSGVLATQNGMTGIAKAWVGIDSTGAILGGAGVGSFNVSLVTKNGTGDFTVTYTTALPNANYSIVTTCAKSTGGSTATAIVNCTGASASQAPTTTTTRFSLQLYQGSAVDSNYSYLAVLSV